MYSSANRTASLVQHGSLFAICNSIYQNFSSSSIQIVFVESVQSLQADEVVNVGSLFVLEMMVQVAKKHLCSSHTSNKRQK